MPHRLSPRSLAGALLAVVLAVGGLVATGSAPAPAGAGAPEGRTWVVDAVDDALGNRWLSEDTGASTVTVAAGDTVEWQFDRAVIDHDLTSRDTQSAWATPLAEYRPPGGAAVRRTFAEPGVYDYLCSIHGTLMHGTVVVEEPSEPGAAPTVTATAAPTSGPAPLAVTFTGDAEDAQGGALTYAWDFGVPERDDDTAVTADAGYTYQQAGSYVATLTVTDTDGNAGTDSVTVEATGGSDPALPAIDATGAPSSGSAPLAVAFSTAVTTSGPVASFAEGLATYPELTGTATLVRNRGRTTAVLQVAGLKAEAHHMVHVHEQPCAAERGGAHFRFDEALPFGETNEIWLPFHSDAEGRSGVVEVTAPQRAGPDAVSIVVHDPDNAAHRIGCVDLVPGTSDLTYAWDFGDGATGTGSDPDHTYAAPGTYTATVSVGGAHSGGGHAAVTDTVRVVVGAADTGAPGTRILGGPVGAVRRDRATLRFASSEAGSTFRCSLDGRPWVGCAAVVSFRGLPEGRHVVRVRATDAAGNTDPTPAVRRWTVDATRPTVRALRPSGVVRDRTPVVRARITDRVAGVVVRGVVLRVDGRVVPRVRYVAGRLTWTPRRALSPGRHAVRLAVSDRAGNRRVVSWRFTLRG
ncbi:PKD domain-containing protein [Nocardioides sp. 503]|uniref:PKD domain-containing protein n=1 Tax=Nocardioides sp. 503 TaxID=2508326 RepID=UPI00106F50D0|nr:PKD domain-containing protein [Nocardioides sp. 503]